MTTNTFSFQSKIYYNISCSIVISSSCTGQWIMMTHTTHETLQKKLIFPSIITEHAIRKSYPCKQSCLFLTQFVCLNVINALLKKNLGCTSVLDVFTTSITDFFQVRNHINKIKSVCYWVTKWNNHTCCRVIVEMMHVEEIIIKTAQLICVLYSTLEDHIRELRLQGY